MKFEPSIDEPIVFGRELKEVNVNKETIGRYVGEYQLTSQVITKVYLKDEVLYLFVPGQPEYELYPIGNNKFVLKILEGYKLEFILDKKGKVTEVLFIQPNGTFKAKKK